MKRESPARRAILDADQAANEAACALETAVVGLVGEWARARGKGRRRAEARLRRAHGLLTQAERLWEGVKDLDQAARGRRLL